MSGNMNGKTSKSLIEANVRVGRANIKPKRPPFIVAVNMLA
jgi:hypothetical protein